MVAGVPVSADVVLRTSFHSIATWLNSKQASSTSEVLEGPQDMETDSAAASPQLNGHSQDSALHSADQAAAQDEIITKVMQELVFHSRAEVGSLSVWHEAFSILLNVKLYNLNISLRYCTFCYTAHHPSILFKQPACWAW